ncbi:MAG TPA: redoxin domain-containing protein [Gemmatimonadales bacterium]|nr:redoxin domain-containing protein [Gemmatimonadales bacterium]
MAPPVAGTPAPDFTLPSTSGQEVTLSALRGKNVLLAFFPLAFTSTCTAELCAMSDDYARFENEHSVALPISVDSIPTLKVFKAREKISVDLLSDFKRDVSRKYGVLNEERFFSNRAYVLIDRNGTIRWVHQEANNSERRDNAEILAELARLG